MTSTAESTPSSLNSFKLTGVKCTNRHLGQGSYGYVEEYIYRELRCAGKKLMSVLREGTTKDEEKALYGNAANECVVLSKLKHPNIVQFLGVHFEGEDPAPILVMEYVPHTLSDFLDRHKKRAPQEITYGILVDVARALCYLHGGSPIIIHRDLSANNVLLTLDLRAKVSDLGTAKILNVSLTEKIERCKKMTKCPGTPAYMPLEACSEDSVYDETIDCFSYGVLILHILTGEWPVPNDKIHDEDHQTNDIHRRQQYIRKIDDNHPLLGLIYSCLDHKSKRPSAKVILDKVLEVQKQCCKQQSNRMTLLTELETNSERRAALERELGQLKDKQKRLDLLHSKEAEVKAMEIGKLEHENEMLRSLVEVRNNEQEALEKRVQSKDDMLYKKEEEISAMKQKMDQEINAVKKRVKEEIQAIQKQRDEEIQAHQKQIDEEMNAKETEIGAKEKEINDYKEKLVKKERLIDEAIRKNSQRAHEALHRSQSQRDAVMEYLRSGTQVSILLYFQFGLLLQKHDSLSLLWLEIYPFPDNAKRAIGRSCPLCSA